MAEATNWNGSLRDRHRATSKSCLATAASTSSAGQVFVRRVLRNRTRACGGHGGFLWRWHGFDLWKLGFIWFIDIYWYLFKIFDGQNWVKPCWNMVSRLVMFNPYLPMVKCTVFDQDMCTIQAATHPAAFGWPALREKFSPRETWHPPWTIATLQICRIDGIL